MAIALFAYIGAMIHAETGYWVCFGIFCAGYLLRFIINLAKNLSDE